MGWHSGGRMRLEHDAVMTNPDRGDRGSDAWPRVWPLVNMQMTAVFPEGEDWLFDFPCDLWALSEVSWQSPGECAAKFKDGGGGQEQRRTRGSGSRQS